MVGTALSGNFKLQREVHITFGILFTSGKLPIHGSAVVKGQVHILVKFSMSPNGFFCVSSLNLICGGSQGIIIPYDLLQLGGI